MEITKEEADILKGLREGKLALTVGEDEETPVSLVISADTVQFAGYRVEEIGMLSTYTITMVQELKKPTHPSNKKKEKKIGFQPEDLESSKEVDTWWDEDEDDDRQDTDFDFGRLTERRR